MDEDHHCVWSRLNGDSERRSSSEVSPAGASVPSVRRSDDLEVISRWEESDTDADKNTTVCIAEAGIPRSEWAKEAMYRLRYSEYKKRFPEKEFVDSRETDAYDDRSIHFLARVGHECVGSLRLIRCEDGFPMEENREVVLPDGTPFVFPDKHPRSGLPVRREEALEASRWVGRRRLLGNGDELLVSFLMLEAGVNRYPRDTMYRRYLVAALDEAKFRGLSRIGWDLIPLTEPQEYRGGMVRGIWLDLSREYPCPRRLPKIPVPGGSS